MTNVFSRNLIPAVAAVLKQKRYFSVKRKRIEKLRLIEAYFLAFALGLAFAFSILTGFIGALQQTMSHGSHAQGSSTMTTSPQSSHLYFSPFFFAKNSPSLKR